MEFLSQYDCKFIYIQGKDNTVADALSRTAFCTSDEALDRAQHLFAEDVASDNWVCMVAPMIQHLDAPTLLLNSHTRRMAWSY